MSSLSIIIITEKSACAIGLNHILSSVFSVEAQIYSDVDSLLSNEQDKFDLLFTDCFYFLSYFDYFAPRRNKTVVLLDKQPYNFSLQYVNINTDESSIIDSLEIIFNKLEKNNSQHNELSQREIDVLKLVASGYINKEIAESLHISINTVLTHRKNITSKLGIRSVSGLSVYAMMNGYLNNI